MTRPLHDLKTYVAANIVFATINGLVAGNEALIANPSVRKESDAHPASYIKNGEIIFATEDEGASIELGEARHEVFFISGWIAYDSIIGKNSATVSDDEMISAIKSHFRTLLNTNNNTVSRTWKWILESANYNEIPIAGKIDFVVKATITDVSAIA